MLKRKKQPMHDYIKKALKNERVMEKYMNRPPYQRNDYLGWIARAALPETKQKRLDQMISELKKGDVYMKMKWNPMKKIKK